MSSSPKGYSSQQKEDRLKAQFVTIEPVREQQHGLSVLAHAYVFAVSTDLVEANSTTSVINATAHVALAGDIIRFTSGTFNNRQFKVEKVATNTITLAETLSSAPVLGVSFEILRHSYARVASDGGISTTPGALQFKRDGADTFVAEDTVTPANNRPLPVKLTDFTGDVTITASNLNVQLTHTGASPDSTQIGDGTDLLAITAAGEANVRSAQLPTALGQQTMAASTGVVIASDQTSIPVAATISGAASSIKITDGTDTLLISGSGEANVIVTSPLPAGTNNIGDVDVLSQPARSHTTDSIRIGDGSDLVNVTAASQLEVAVTAALPAGTNNIGDVDVLSQPARSHTIDSIRLGDGTDLVNVTGSNQLEVAVTASLPSGTNNIGDVDVLTQPARSHTTDSIRIGDGTDLVNVTASNQLEVSVTAALPAGTNNIGDVDVLTQPARSHTTDSIRLGDGTDLVNVTSANQLEVFQAGRSVITTVRNDYSSVNVTTGAWVQLIASTSANIHEFDIFDSSGQTLELGTGAAASETRLILIPPGGNGRVPVFIASGTRISIRAVSASATVGEIDINFYS